jgi:hypothetical protein
MAHNIAKAIAEHMVCEQPFAALLQHLPETEASALKDQKNRARVLDAVFNGAGVEECLTDFGRLKRTKGAGTKGTLLVLSVAPQNED